MFDFHIFSIFQSHRESDVNLKALFLTGSLGIALQGCASMGGFSTDAFKSYSSPQQVIDQKNLNNNNGTAKDYVYYWDPKQGQQNVQSLTPKLTLAAYCTAKGGKLKQVHKSSMKLIKDKWSHKLLSTYSSVQQGIGAYQCLENNGSTWLVSIEPVAEKKLAKDSETRLVALQTKALSLDEINQFYGMKNVTEKNNTQNQKNVITQKKDDKKTLEKKQDKKTEEKKIEEKKLDDKKVNNQQTITPSVKVTVSPQTQQMQLYAAARKDLGRGQNQINACNNAELAYGYGRLRGNTGVNAYAESGMLVARCLTSIPAYSRRFNNADDRAKKILQNLASSYNHAGAKQMLKQLK